VAKPKDRGLSSPRRPIPLRKKYLEGEDNSGKTLDHTSKSDLARIAPKARNIRHEPLNGRARIQEAEVLCRARLLGDFGRMWEAEERKAIVVAREDNALSGEERAVNLGVRARTTVKTSATERIG
jgi:hypothetical protein